MLDSVFEQRKCGERATHCAVCGLLLPVDGRWWRRYCSRYCGNVSTGAARAQRDPGYAAMKAREWRANPPPRTEEQIAADRARRAANERRRRRRKVEVIRLKGLCGSRVVTSTGQAGIVQSTRRIGEDRFARVLLDDNREIEVHVSELRHPLPNETVIR
jgi:predicted nucleic acid-binding Zn ribbon protein